MKFRNCGLTNPVRGPDDSVHVYWVVELSWLSKFVQLLGSGYYSTLLALRPPEIISFGQNLGLVFRVFK